MTFEEELDAARDEGMKKGLEIGIQKSIEKGKLLGRQEMLENIVFAFRLFREGKSDEEVFRSERFSSMEQVKEIRKMWNNIVYAV